VKRYFSVDNCVAHSGQEVKEFVEHLSLSARVLFIGTVGLEQTSLFYPTQFSKARDVDFKFVIEKRPHVSTELNRIGEAHKEYLKGLSKQSPCRFEEVEVVARDGATTAGRNATSVASSWFEGGYTDIVIDATGMSRGVCFPLVQYACLVGAQKKMNVHVVVAASNKPSIGLITEANDRADWMHGFQGHVESDRTSDALKLWVPQLTENAVTQTSKMYSSIAPPVAEVCPIVPFPSANPKRGDELLNEYSELLRERWEGTLLNIMYAHESNPIDVYRSIHQMHAARELVFNGCDKKAVTILSPAGWRIGSLGMLLAAIELSLPVLYVETVGYNATGPVPTSIQVTEPDCLWHLWLVGSVYENEACDTL
jgi:hypothetical protein